MIPETPTSWIETHKPQPKPRKRYIVEANDCRITVDGTGGYVLQDGLLRFVSADGLLTVFAIANVNYFQEVR
jgi:hypothetical protein